MLEKILGNRHTDQILPEGAIYLKDNPKTFYELILKDTPLAQRYLAELKHQFVYQILDKSPYFISKIARLLRGRMYEEPYIRECHNEIAWRQHNTTNFLTAFFGKLLEPGLQYAADNQCLKHEFAKLEIDFGSFLASFDSTLENLYVVLFEEKKLDLLITVIQCTDARIMLRELCAIRSGTSLMQNITACLNGRDTNYEKVLLAIMERMKELTDAEIKKYDFTKVQKDLGIIYEGSNSNANGNIATTFYEIVNKGKTQELWTAKPVLNLPRVANAPPAIIEPPTAPPPYESLPDFNPDNLLYIEIMKLKALVEQQQHEIDILKQQVAEISQQQKNMPGGSRFAS